MSIDTKGLKCPWRSFQDCLRNQCPFYGTVYMTVRDNGGFTKHNGCLRAKAEITNGESSTQPQYASWIRYLDGEHIMPDVYYRCSACKTGGFTKTYPVCPQCGAKMR